MEAQSPPAAPHGEGIMFWLFCPAWGPLAGHVDPKTQQEAPPRPQEPASSSTLLTLPLPYPHPSALTRPPELGWPVQLIPVQLTPATESLGIWLRGNGGASVNTELASLQEK